MRNESSDPLFPLVDAVLEGRPIDWKTATSNLDPESLAAAAVLEELVSLFGQGRSPLAGDGEMDDPIPMRWGRLEIRSELGKGSYGRVYKALDPQLRRDVALKVRQAGGQDAESFHRAVLREGQLLAQVHHQNVATVYGLEEEAGRLGLVMELVDGETLEDLALRDGPLPPGEVARIGRDLAGALAELHAKGIVHRDVKAQNVLRQGDGRVVLVDFGVGVAPGQGLGASTLSGTPLYMAPELLAGGEPAPESDVYSLGVLLYFLANGGKFPVDADSVEELLDRHRKAGVVSRREMRKELPKGLVEIIERCLAPKPEGRPAAGEVARGLRALGGGPSRRLRTILVTASLVLAAASLLAVPGMLRSREGTRRLQEGVALHGAGRLGDALDKLARAAQLRPKDPEVYASRARTYDALGDFEKSLVDSQHAFDLRARASEIGQWRIEVLYLRDRLQYEKALELTAGLAEIPGALPGDYRELAHLNERVGNLPQAIEALQHAIAGDPSPNNLGLLGLLLIQRNSPSEALVVLDRADAATRGDQDSSYPILVRSLAFTSLGELGEAKALLEKVTGSPDRYNWWAEHWLAQLAAFQGDTTEAFQRLAVRHAPADKTDAYFQRRDRLLEARISLEEGEVQRARRALEPLRVLEPLPSFLRDIRSAALILAEAGAADQSVVEALREARVKIGTIANEYPSRFAEAAALQLEAELALLNGDPQRASEIWEVARGKWTDFEMLRTGLKIAKAMNRVQESRDLLGALVGKKGEILRNGLFIDWRIACEDLGEILGRQPDGCPDALFPATSNARR